jgi:hypothetical protein
MALQEIQKDMSEVLIEIFINQMAGRKLLLFRRIRKNHQR